MFRTVPVSIIRSSSLYTQQWYMSHRFADSLRAESGRNSVLILLASCMTYTIAVFTVKSRDDGQRNCLKHVEFYSKNKFEKLVHLVGFIVRIFHYARSPESQTAKISVWYIPLLFVQWKTPDDGQRNCLKLVEFYSKNKFEKLVHLVGFIIRIYHDARSPELQAPINFFMFIHHHGTERLQQDKFSWNYIPVIFITICRCTPILLKIGQALRDTVHELQTLLNFSPSLVFKTDIQCVFCEV